MAASTSAAVIGIFVRYFELCVVRVTLSVFGVLVP